MSQSHDKRLVVDKNERMAEAAVTNAMGTPLAAEHSNFRRSSSALEQKHIRDTTECGDSDFYMHSITQGSPIVSNDP